MYLCVPSLRVRVQEGYKICTLTPTLHLPLLKPPGFSKPLTITTDKWDLSLPESFFIQLSAHLSMLEVYCLSPVTEGCINGGVNAIQARFDRQEDLGPELF